MNKIRIRNYQDLLLEQERLELQLNMQQDQLRYRMEVLKAKVAPVTRFVSWLGKAGRAANHPLLRAGLKIGVDLLLKKSVFRKTNWLVSLASSFLIRNVAAGIASGKAAALVNKAKAAIDKKRHGTGEDEIADGYDEIRKE